MLLQYCWCHSRCSCLNGYGIVMFLGCWDIFDFPILISVSHTPDSLFYPMQGGAFSILILFFYVEQMRSFFFRSNHISVKCMSILFLKKGKKGKKKQKEKKNNKAGPLPWASQGHTLSSPHFYSATVCYTPPSAQSTGSVCVCVCVSASASACVRAYVVRVCRQGACGSDNSHFKTRALVWNLAQFVKNVKEDKKETFKAHRLVSTFPTFAL